MVRDPRELLDGYVEVSSLPLIYTRISEAVNDPRTSMADIGAIISEDSGLSVRLLRIVNSAFYGFPANIETITRALSIIGTKQLRDLALGTSVMSLFKGIPADLVNMESFWIHSLACGGAARALATQRREANTETFLVAGLLHDIGRLIIYKKAPEKAREAIHRSQSMGEPLFESEREVLGYNHARMGGILLQEWKIPPTLEEMVGHHHNPERAKHFPVETAIVHVADIIAHVVDLGSSGERLVPPLNPEAWERVGLSPTVLPAVLQDVDSQIKELVETMLRHGD